ncbi:MAG: metallophosphoesterase family protein, partial [Armatimonadota bacterium]
AGNHESPRSADAGCILSLYSNIQGIMVEDLKYSPLRVDALDLQVFCVPHRGLHRFDETPPSPDPHVKYNILMLHGTLQGIESGFYDTYIVPREAVRREDWDYIALGHYHKFTKISDNACYSGSLEYTSPNFWEELDEPKGFVEYDLEKRIMNFHKVEPLREFVLLSSIDAEGLSASEVDGRIAAALGRVKGGIAGKVVRLVVENIPRDVQRDLDHKALRAARAEALHFDMVFMPPKRKRLESPFEGGVDSSRRTLEQDWSEYVDAYSPPKGVEREELKQLGLQYLARIAEASDAADLS